MLEVIFLVDISQQFSAVLVFIYATLKSNKRYMKWIEIMSAPLRSYSIFFDISQQRRHHNLLLQIHAQ